jgi:hypothetical protein
MRYFIITCILLLAGTFCGILHAQDRIVLRNGTTIKVYVRRSLENRVEYTYPGETSVYERPKSAISYILYQDGRKEVCNENTRTSSTDRSSATSQSRGTSSSSSASSANRTSPARNRLSDNGEIFWQDVKTTFSESAVRRMTRLKRISAVSVLSYKDAIQQLKQRAAAIGGTTVLLMDVPEENAGNDIEVIGIAYRDEKMEYTPQNADGRNAVSQESPSNIRRRRIAQQMESYNNESNPVVDDDRNSSARDRASANRRTTPPPTDEEEGTPPPDVIYLMNGRVVRGTIEELEPDDFVSVRTLTGRVYEYSMDDVKRISRGSSNRSAASPSRYNDFNNGYDDDYYVSGYKGTFDAGYNFSIGGTGEKGVFEFNTSHGYQINEYLFVGAGVGLHLYNARDPKMKDPANYPQYVGSVGATGRVINPTDSVTYLRAVDSSYMTMPLFLDLRGYLPLQNGKVIPFAMFRLGYAFNLNDGFGGMGLYVNPAVGVRFQLSPMIGINVSIGYAFQHYGGIPGKNRDGGYGYYYVKNKTGAVYEAKGAGGISLKFGIEF